MGGGRKVGASDRSNRTQTARENLQQRGPFFAGHGSQVEASEAVRAELLPQFSSALILNVGTTTTTAAAAPVLCFCWWKSSRGGVAVFTVPDPEAGGGGGLGTPSHPGERRGFLPAALFCA
jgi:hypothetical protein